MKNKRTFLAAFVSALLLVVPAALAKDKKPIQSGWAEVVNSSADVLSRPSEGKKVLAHLGTGAVVATLEAKPSGTSEWTQVRAVVPSTLEPATGWVQSAKLKTFPVDRFPSDEDLEKVLGGEYLEDVNVQYMKMARYVVQQNGQDPLLAVYFGSTLLPQTRLQIFSKTGGTWTAGPYVEFLSSQLKTAVAEIEVRDLVGDGNECLLTHETFAQTFGSSGVNLVIRRVETNRLKTLWKAPLEVRNLTSFPPKMKTLDPPEKNIGAPGTISKGSVEYRRNGKVDEPVWKGKVEFHIPDREAPVNTLSVEKVCHWNGSEFVPLN